MREEADGSGDGGGVAGIRNNTVLKEGGRKEGEK